MTWARADHGELGDHRHPDSVHGHVRPMPLSNNRRHRPPAGASEHHAAIRLPYRASFQPRSSRRRGSRFHARGTPELGASTPRLAPAPGHGATCKELVVGRGQGEIRSMEEDNASLKLRHPPASAGTEAFTTARAPWMPIRVVPSQWVAGRGEFAATRATARAESNIHSGYQTPVAGWHSAMSEAVEDLRCVSSHHDRAELEANISYAHVHCHQNLAKPRISCALESARQPSSKARTSFVHWQTWSTHWTNQARRSRR